MKMKKVLAMACALALTAAIAIGGTIAYLTDKTEEVVNTFTVGNVKIDLTETWNTDSDNDQSNDSWQAKLIPGTTYTKDPKISVEEGSEDCYLFFEVVEKNNPKTYLTYALNDDGWTNLNLEGRTVYWREAKGGESFNLLTGNAGHADGFVTVKDTVGSTAVPMPSATPTITFKGYAIQSANFADAGGNDDANALAAWNALNAQQ